MNSESRPLIQTEFPISDFGFAVGLRPTRRTVACGRLIASSFR
jgi:hypothetical protein